MRNERTVLAVLLASAAVLYAFSLRAYDVGFFNDDAFFLIGAKSLLQGRFVELNDPRLPDLINYLPGYPLLLAPFVGLFPSTFIPVQCLSAALLLFSVFLVWRLGALLGGFWIAFAASVLFAFNPLSASLSGTVMSDIPYLAVSLLVLGLAIAGWEDRQRPFWMAVGALSAFLFYVRPVGLLLPAVVVLMLLRERRKHEAIALVAVTALLVAPYLLYMKGRHGYFLAYGVEFMAPYLKGSFLERLLANWMWNLPYYLNDIFVRTLFRWPRSAFAPALDGITMFAGVMLSIWGALKSRRGKWDVVWIYAALYTLIHLSWSKQAGRYMFPVLPIILLAFFQGIGQFCRARGAMRNTCAAVLALSLLLSFVPLSNVVRASVSGKGPFSNRTPRTHEWIRANTPPESVFAAELDGRLYLHTGRHAVHLQKTPTAREFFKWMDDSGVTHLLAELDPNILRTRSGRDANDPFDLSLLVPFLNDPKLFQPVFSDETEGTMIFRRYIQ